MQCTAVCHRSCYAGYGRGFGKREFALAIRGLTILSIKIRDITFLCVGTETRAMERPTLDVTNITLGGRPSALRARLMREVGTERQS